MLTKRLTKNAVFVYLGGTSRCFFTRVASEPVCLVWQKCIVVFKDKKKERHFPTRHVNYALNFSLWGREEKNPENVASTANFVVPRQQRSFKKKMSQFAVIDATFSGTFVNFIYVSVDFWENGSPALI